PIEQHNGGNGGGSTTGAGGANNSGGGTTNPGGGSGGGSALHEICDNHVDDDGDSFVDCADQDCFTSTMCFASCVDLCSDGTSICDSNGVRSCQLDTSTGCRAFNAPVPCGNGLVCSGGACVANCQNQCTLAAKTCSNTGGV